MDMLCNGQAGLAALNLFCLEPQCQRLQHRVLHILHGPYDSHWMHNDRCPRAESKTVFIMYCTSAITLSFFGWAACWEISVRHHPDTFFPRHGSHYHVSGLGDACCAACARKSSTAMNLWNATDTNFTQLHHNFVNLMHLQPVCSHCFSTAHLCSGVSLQRSMCWPSTAAPGLTDTLSPSLGMHVSHYGKSMKIRNKRSKCKTHQRYDLSESPIDFEAEQVFVTSARLKK